MLRRYVVTVAGTERLVAIEPLSDGRWRVTIDGRETVLWPSADGELVLNEGGRVFRVDTAVTDKELLIRVGSADAAVKVESQARHLLRSGGQAGGGDGAEEVCAPMPGRIVRVAVTAGDTVGTGHPLVVVEAMKMENELRASRAGKVAQVWAREGQAVEAGERLIRIDAE
jgi:biotin carboxyl carrier protein